MSKSKNQPNKDRDVGGRILPGKKYWLNHFIVEVCVESPGDIDEDEAMEDAAEFMETVRHTKGRVHSSFVSVLRVDEVGPKRPEGMGVKIKNTKPWPQPLGNKKTSKKATKTKKKTPKRI